MTKGADVGSLIVRACLRHARRRFWAAFLGVAIGVGVRLFDVEHGRGWCWDGPGGRGECCTQLKESKVSRRDTGRGALLDHLAMGEIW